MKRNRHTPEEKTVMAIEVIKGEKTRSEIASENGVHPSILSKWKKKALDGMTSLFRKDAAKKRIDRIYTAHPEFGCRRICA